MTLKQKDNIPGMSVSVKTSFPVVVLGSRRHREMSQAPGIRP